MTLAKRVCTALFVALAVIGCTQTTNDGLCHIKGTANSKFNGKKIFLVPIDRPATMETVDSVVIEDGKFEFTSSDNEMKVIRLDYHYRTGVQDLLVVAEPGELEVIIDSISSGKGTPQNDSLQHWKELTEHFNKECMPFRITGMNAEKTGNTALAEQMKAKLDSLRNNYRRQSHQLGESMKEGVLHDFLLKQFPKTYKKKMPDGSIEELPFFE
ncbi:MAG: DUF4369 domain-containing protein [Prevotella sp.]